MESNVENCVICQDPIDMSDRMTLGGSFQLIECPHKYHRVCFNNHVEQYDNDDEVKCAVCSRVVPLPEVVAATMKLTMPIVTDPRSSEPICDDSQPSSPTTSLAGLFDHINMTDRSPMQQDRTLSNNNNDSSTGLPPSQRNQNPPGPARPISPTRTFTEQNMQHLLQEAVRQLAAQQREQHSHSSQRSSETSSVYEEDPYVGMELYTDNGKPRCLNNTKAFPYPQCKNAASYPPHDPVDCAAHFKSKVLGKDKEKLTEVKTKAKMLYAVNKSKKEMAKSTRQINESVPGIVEKAEKHDAELNSELEKIDATDNALNSYFKKISPPNSRGTSRGSQTPRPQQQ